MLPQVIAREDKGEEHGIDYKYSDMITSYGGSGSNIEPLEESYTQAPTTQLPNLNQVHISWCISDSLSSYFVEVYQIMMFSIFMFDLHG